MKACALSRRWRFLVSTQEITVVSCVFVATRDVVPGKRSKPGCWCDRGLDHGLFKPGAVADLLEAEALRCESIGEIVQQVLIQQFQDSLSTGYTAMVCTSKNGVQSVDDRSSMSEGWGDGVLVHV